MSLFRPRPADAESRIREDFDREAWAHFREITRAALRLTRRPAEAEDLASEVFLQAWKSFGKFESGTNCRAWLYKILWNVNQQRVRKRVPFTLALALRVATYEKQ